MVKYRIEIKKSAIKELKSIPKDDLNKIINRIKSLSSDPRPPGCIELTNKEDYRIRVGNYRIVYSINDNILNIIVIKIGHRKQIYR